MMFMSACVVTTQFTITLIAAWVGRGAGSWGRKPLLLIGFGVLPVRGVLYTLTHNLYLLVGIQVLDGIGAGIFGVVSVLVIADLTRGTGRFNLTLGAIATAVGIGAALSQTIAGTIVHHFSDGAGFLFLASVAAAAFAILWLFMPETLDWKGDAPRRYRRLTVDRCERRYLGYRRTEHPRCHRPPLEAAGGYLGRFRRSHPGRARSAPMERRAESGRQGDRRVPVSDWHDAAGGVGAQRRSVRFSGRASGSLGGRLCDEAVRAGLWRRHSSYSFYVERRYGGRSHAGRVCRDQGRQGEGPTALPADLRVYSERGQLRPADLKSRQPDHIP